MAFASIHRPEEIAFGSWTNRLRAALAERRAQKAVYRRTLDELTALSDRDLADFGYHRSELPAVARAAARGA